MADAGPRLHYERGREDVRLIDSTALLVLFSLTLEPAIRESSSSTEDRLLKGILHGAAESKSQPILLSEVVIDFGIERSAVLPVLSVLLIVMVYTCSICIGIRMRTKCI